MSMDSLSRWIYQNTIKRVRSIPNFWNSCDIHIVHDGNDWVIQEVSKSLTKAITKENFARVSSSSYGYFLSEKVVHFNSVVPTRRFGKNKVIATWYHVATHDRRLNFLENIVSSVDVLHTTAQITKKTLVRSGFPKEKIIVLPMGIDLRVFRRFSLEEKRNIRASIGIPRDTFVIGSFQKDGVGWGAGSEPKMVKGPDIFCDVVERLAKTYPVHVLLSGPSRGYVRKRLERAGIGYTHRYVKRYFEMNTLFQACDLYLIASRVEGGPMALLESWATGIPLVSTRVGMVADAVTNGHDGLLAPIEDCATLAENVARVLENDNVRNQLIAHGQKSVQQYDWNILIDQYWQKLYVPLLLVLNEKKR